MKNILFVLVFWLSNISAQKLTENRTDEFTKSSVKKTSWEKLAFGGGFSKHTASYRITKINEIQYFDLKLMMSNSIYSISKDDKIMFKLKNDSVITLYSLSYELTCKGCGATGFVGSDGWGTETNYVMSKDQVDALINTPVSKIRIYTSKGYIEDEVTTSSAKELRASLMLVQ